MARALRGGAGGGGLTDLLLVVGALLLIAGSGVLGPRVGLPGPLLLVLVGLGVSLVPGAPRVDVEPDWILEGVLPPLLYAASAAVPAMDLRRDVGAIGGLSVVLVALSTAVLGLFFAWALPDLPLAWAFALGAVVSPTDAVATRVVKALGVTPRAVSVLEGEGLLNDATALVLLRTAVAGTAASVSAGGVLADLAIAVVVAMVVGFAVGHAMILLRARIPDPTANTVVSFTVPFLAALPAEALGGSGLVAAVAAGLVAGRHSAVDLNPRQRLSDQQNWRAVELVLEGGLFLLLGLELSAIAGDVDEVGTAFAVAAGALVLLVLVRAAYVAPLLAYLHARAGRGATARSRLEAFGARLEEPEGLTDRRGRTHRLSPRRVERLRTRVRRVLLDIEHLLAAPLGPREGAVVVWAGMRGAVTVAAAQTLPEDAPSRPLLVLVAFLVAVGSLLLQGATLPVVVRWLRPAGLDPEAVERDRTALRRLLVEAGAAVTPQGDPQADALARIRAQRAALIVARDDGAHAAAALDEALAVLDADEIGWELRGGPPR